MIDGQLRLVGREVARLLEFEVAVQALFKWLISVGPAGWSAVEWRASS